MPLLLMLLLFGGSFNNFAPGSSLSAAMNQSAPISSESNSPSLGNSQVASGTGFQTSSSPLTSSANSGDVVIANIPVGLEPNAIAYDPLNQLLYVGGYHNITVIDGSNNSVVAGIPYPGVVFSAITFDSANGEIYLAGTCFGCPGSIVTALDTKNDSFVANATLPYPYAYGITYDSENNEIYAVPNLIGGSGTNATMSVISGTTGKIVQNVSLPYLPIGAIAFDSGDGGIYVPQDNTSATLDGSQGLVSVIDGSSNVIEDTISTGTVDIGNSAETTGIVYDPSNSLVYIGGGYCSNKTSSGNVCTIDGSSLNALTSRGIISTSSVSSSSGYGTVALAHDSNNSGLYVLQGGASSTVGDLIRVNESNYQTVDSVPLGAGSVALALDPSNGYIYVTLSNEFGQNLVSVVCHSGCVSTIKYTVDFTESGLPSGTKWSVTFGGNTSSGSTSTIDFSVLNGNYTVTIPSVGYFTVLSDEFPKYLVVDGADLQELPHFSQLYNVTFVGNGLPNGKNWSVTLIGNVNASSVQSNVTRSSNKNFQSFAEAPNTYKYMVSPVPGYAATITSGFFDVAGNMTVYIDFVFSPYNVTFTESGLNSGSSWSVTLNGLLESSTMNQIIFSEPNGTFGFDALAASLGNQWYTQTPANGNVTVHGANFPVAISFSPVKTKTSISKVGGMWRTIPNTGLNGGYREPLTETPTAMVFNNQTSEWGIGFAGDGILTNDCLGDSTPCFSTLLSVVNSSNAVVENITVGIYYDVSAVWIQSMVFTPDGTVYVLLDASGAGSCSQCGEVAAIQGGKETLVTDLPATASGLVYDSSNDNLYVVSNGELLKFNLATDTSFSFVASVPHGFFGSSLAIANGKIYVSVFNSVLVFDDTSYELDANISNFQPMTPCGIGNGSAFIPGDMLYDPTNGEIYVSMANHFNQCDIQQEMTNVVEVIDTSSYSVSTDISIYLPNTDYNLPYPAGFDSGASMAYNPLDHDIYLVVSYASSPCSTFCNAGVLAVIDGLTNGVIGTLQIGKSSPSQPVFLDGIAFDPASGDVYIDGFAFSNVAAAYSNFVDIVSTGVSPSPPEYAVSFTEKGLPANTQWSVTLNTVVNSSTSPTIIFQEPNGTYAYSIEAAIGVSVGIQYGTHNTTSGSLAVNGFAVEGQTTTYVLQYELTASSIPSSGGTISPATDTYHDAAVPFSISAKASSGFVFSDWSPSSSVSVDNVSSSKANATMSGPGELDARFAYLVTFSESGLPAGTVWNATLGAQTLSSNETTISFPVLVGGILSYSLPLNITTASSSGIRFVPNATGGTIDVPSVQQVAIKYVTQYQVVIVANPSGEGTVNPSGAKWFNSKSNITIVATPDSGFQFVSWGSTNFTALSIANVALATTNATINGPGTITAAFAKSVPVSTTVSLSCAPSSIAVNASATCTATVTGSSPTGNVTFAAQSGGVTFSSHACTLSSGGKCSVTATASALGLVNINASYAGDSVNAKSSGAFVLDVNIVSSSSSTTSVSGGGASSNQTSSTGVSVAITGSSAANGTNVTITSEDLSSASSGTGFITLGGSKYFDVNVSGISDGTAALCMEDSQANSGTTMEYWNGSAWVHAANIQVVGTTVCGTVPVSALTGTNIVLGTPISSVPPPSLLLVNVTAYVSTDSQTYILVTANATVSQMHSYSFLEMLLPQYGYLPNGTWGYLGYYEGTFGAVSGAQQGLAVSVSVSYGGLAKTGSVVASAQGKTASLSLIFYAPVSTSPVLDRNWSVRR
ncbi:MAG: Ig-like domain repeat protein [Nitrososphaerales archaeon]